MSSQSNCLNSFLPAPIGWAEATRSATSFTKHFKPRPALLHLVGDNRRLESRRRACVFTDRGFDRRVTEDGL